MILFEVYTGKQPFKGYHRGSESSYDKKEEEKLKSILESHKNSYKGNSFVKWLLEWVASPKKSVKAHSEMITMLNKWKSRRIKLVRYVDPDYLFK